MLAKVDPRSLTAFALAVTAIWRLTKKTTTATIRLRSITLISQLLDVRSLLNVIWPLRRRALDLPI